MAVDAFAELLGRLPEAMLLVTRDGQMLAANRALSDLLELPNGSLIGRGLSEITATPAEQVSRYLSTCSRNRQMVIGTLALYGHPDRVVDCRCEGCLLRPGSPASPALILLRLKLRKTETARFALLTQKIDQLSQEIRQRKHTQSLLDGQRHVLELMVQGVSLQEVLAALTELAENHASRELLASILLLDEEGLHLHHGAAPRLPPSYVQAIEAAAIGPQAGSCGSAAYLGEAVIVADIATDPRWTAYREVALNHGLQACWSVPILSREGKVLGTFALYHCRPGEPASHDLQMITAVSRLAAIAIERSRAEEERLRLLTREQEARRTAEEAGRAKDEFLAMVSHELRTPLQAILGWTLLLNTRRLDATDRTRALEVIERNVRSQVQLVEDLLDFSRIISGKLRLDVCTVEPMSVIEAAVDVARPAADAKDIRLTVVLDPRCGPVSGDPERLQQVMWNLLSNAVKFTPKRGRVQVRLQRINSHIEITVSDTGQGISQTFLPHVFERFRQADSAITRQHGGLGLGLAIAQHLVELHGGTLAAHSEGENKGATFTVCLPLLVIHQRQRQPAASGEAPSSVDTGQSLLDDDQPLQGLRVLVVDDQPDARELLAAVLEEHGAMVIAEASVPKALERIKQLPPDVLVSDIEMPGEDGYSLIQQVRALDAAVGGETPALALTAHARPADRIRALAAGYQMHIAKPVEPTELVVTLASLARRLNRQASG